MQNAPVGIATAAPSFNTMQNAAPQNNNRPVGQQRQAPAQATRLNADDVDIDVPTFLRRGNS
jgi:hypothetical protein